ncbi:MAG: hypothetical protein H0V96_05435 [Acidimicrobiia bacterium]|nr:hypothetical protein [Acidimicrobiia bacterium]
MPIRRLAAGIGALALVVGCTDSEPGTSSTVLSPSPAEVSSASTPPATVEVDPAVDGDIAARMLDGLEDLKSTVETMRGLSFLDPPRIRIVTAEQLATRHGAAVDATLDRAEVDADTRLLRMLGLLGAGQDLRALLAELSAETPAALYDPVVGTLVVGASPDELGPTARSVVVRGLVQALADQYHRVTTRTGNLTRAGRFDEAAALGALFEADATYFQLVYVQGLPGVDRVAVAAAAPEPPPNLPSVLAEQLTLTAERGIAFVEAMVRHGGTGQVDAAYEATPLTTEGLLHPERLLAGEPGLTMPAIELAIDGYRVVEQGSLGEMGLRSLLVDALDPEILTRAADGWGADQSVLLFGGGDTAWVYAHRADSVADAVEVAQGFLDHATGVLGLTDAVEARGGVEYADGPYLFVDREGDGLAVVVASDVEAGRTLRDLVVIP